MSETKNISLHGLRTFLQPLIRLINRKAESWEDLKGKPFGSEFEETTKEILSQTEPASGSEMYFALKEPLVEGQTYIVTWNGVVYECVSHNYENYIMIGNNAIYEYDDGIMTDSGEPFAMEMYIDSSDVCVYVAEGDTSEYTFSITAHTIEETIKKLDSKYIDVEMPKGILTQDNYLETTAGMQKGNGEVFNNYGGNYASGYMSHAEGSGTNASGEYSHAEGSNTSSKGLRSHAEGYLTVASGEYSHSEGYVTTAYGSRSHAEGSNTIAYDDSHAEGQCTVASAISHSEGRDTLAMLGSHSEGFGYSFNLYISGLCSSKTYTYSSAHSSISSAALAECKILVANGKIIDIINIDTSTKTITLRESIGDSSSTSYYSNLDCLAYQTGAFGDSSHVEGIGTIAEGSANHAEGHETITKQYYSHAEGDRTKAFGQASHAEGAQTIASGNRSHAEGADTVANGIASHAEGWSTKAYSDNQHVQGRYNIPDEDSKYAHIVGNGLSSGSSNAHTLDWNGNAWYQGSVCVGGTNGDAPAASLAANGLILTDEATGTKYRVYINNAKLTMEVIS